MQLDMHYFGTYAMARAAGVKDHIARVMATAAEYVDDSDYVNVTLTDGMQINAVPTAHHPTDLKQNIDSVDQRRTWVPFHFIPGNAGATPEERLVCRMDSDIARQMVDHNIALAREDYGYLLAGITAHVYADTFSHYGFSGISSDLNKVEPSSIALEVADSGVLDYIRRKAVHFAEKYVVGHAANLLRLGHGSVATYPDRPFLKWSFTYSSGGQSGNRPNRETFLLACEKLHGMFGRFAAQYPEAWLDAAAARPFAEISKDVADILAVEADVDGRIEAWQAAAVSGKIFHNPARTRIPNYDPRTFVDELKALHTYDSARANRTLVYLFLRAADVHRDYVLGSLLPAHGIHLT